MFGKKKKAPTVEILPVPSSDLLSRLTFRSTKEICVSEYEKEYFSALEDALRLEGWPVAWFSAERMSSGSIRVSCNAGIVGTVHLRKKYGSIQYFTSPLDAHDMDDAPLEAVIAVIPYWVAYTKGLFNLRQAVTTV